MKFADIKRFWETKLGGSVAAGCSDSASVQCSEHTEVDDEATLQTDRTKELYIREINCNSKSISNGALQVSTSSKPASDTPDCSAEETRKQKFNCIVSLGQCTERNVIDIFDVAETHHIKATKVRHNVVSAQQSRKNAVTSSPGNFFNRIRNSVHGKYKITESQSNSREASSNRTSAEKSAEWGHVSYADITHRLTAKKDSQRIHLPARRSRYYSDAFDGSDYQGTQGFWSLKRKKKSSTSKNTQNGQHSDELPNRYKSLVSVQSDALNIRLSEFQTGKERDSNMSKRYPEIYSAGANQEKSGREPMNLSHHINRTWTPPGLLPINIDSRNCQSDKMARRLDTVQRHSETGELLPSSAPCSVYTSPAHGNVAKKTKQKDPLWRWRADLNIKFNEIQSFWQMKEKKSVVQAVKERRCVACGCFLAQRFYEKNSMLYCEEDYWNKFGQKCQKCRCNITGPIMIAGSLPFHPECFTCIRCHMFISEGDRYSLILPGKEVPCATVFCCNCFEILEVKESRYDSLETHEKETECTSIMVINYQPENIYKKGDLEVKDSILPPHIQHSPSTSQVASPVGQVVSSISSSSSTLKIGDRILQVNGLSVNHNALDLIDRLKEASGPPLQMTVERAVKLKRQYYENLQKSDLKRNSSIEISLAEVEDVLTIQCMDTLCQDEDVIKNQPLSTKKKENASNTTIEEEFFNLHSCGSLDTQIPLVEQVACSVTCSILPSIMTSDKVCCSSDMNYPGYTAVKHSLEDLRSNGQQSLEHKNKSFAEDEKQYCEQKFEISTDEIFEHLELDADVKSCEMSQISPEFHDMESKVENKNEKNFEALVPLPVPTNHSRNSTYPISISNVYLSDADCIPPQSVNDNEHQLNEDHAFEEDAVQVTQQSCELNEQSLLSKVSSSPIKKLELNDDTELSLDSLDLSGANKKSEDMSQTSPITRRGGTKRTRHRRMFVPAKMSPEIDRILSKENVNSTTMDEQQLPELPVVMRKKGNKQPLKASLLNQNISPPKRSNSLRTTTDGSTVIIRKASPESSMATRCTSDTNVAATSYAAYTPSTMSYYYQHSPGTKDLSRSESMRIHSGLVDRSHRVFRPCDLIHGEVLGAGFFGTAIKVTHRDTGEVMVLKVLNSLDEDVEKTFIKEVKVMRNMNHPNVLHFIGVLYKDKKLNVITEFIECGTLRSLIADLDEPLPWRRRLEIARDISSGMSYLHAMRIIHRDLNSGNCFVKKDGAVVVADFGLARVMQRQTSSLSRRKRYTVVGNPYWMAPEMLHDFKYDERVDVFSFGIVLCEIIGRVCANPEYLPRRNDFGLAVQEFNEKFCDGCPPFYFAIAALACDMEPDSRPPFAVLETWYHMLLMRYDVPQIRIPPELVEVTKDIYRRYGLVMPDRDAYDDVLAIKGSKGTTLGNESVSSPKEGSKTGACEPNNPGTDGGIGGNTHIENGVQCTSFALNENSNRIPASSSQPAIKGTGFFSSSPKHTKVS